MKSIKNNKEFLASIVIPCYNEELSILDTIHEIKKELKESNIQHEIIVVDDGSTDRTFEVIYGLSNDMENLKAIKFSKNFGKESAMLAGLRKSFGDIVITIDADMQHPPDLIPQMLEKWNNGYKIVNAVKVDRNQDTIISRTRAHVFNIFMQKISGLRSRNSSDYKLLDREIVNILINQLGERERFFRGLTTWIGFQQEKIFFEPGSRTSGKSKWSIVQLLNLAATGIVSFTSVPLRIITVLGIILLCFGFFVSADALISWFNGKAVSGFATTIITLLLIGSFLMISLGIIGEYIAKIYDEVKKRPEYIIEKSIGFDDSKEIN